MRLLRLECGFGNLLVYCCDAPYNQIIKKYSNSRHPQEAKRPQGSSLRVII